MVEMIIKDNRGFLLINSIDKNNDSPAHLAAFRGQIPILINLAKNKAFLDQPNAESKDPLSTITCDETRMEVISKLQRLNLGDKTQKHLQNLNKRMSAKGNTSRKGDISATSRFKRDEEPERKDETEQIKMKKGLSYFNDIINGNTEKIEKEAISQSMIEAMEPDGEFDQSDEDFLFELPPPMQEMDITDSRVVTSLFPGRGFFYLPKTTTFDRDWVDVNDIEHSLFQKIESTNEREEQGRKNTVSESSETVEEQMDMAPRGKFKLTMLENPVYESEDEMDYEGDKDFNRLLLKDKRDGNYQDYFIDSEPKVPNLSLVGGRRNPFY